MHRVQAQRQVATQLESQWVASIRELCTNPASQWVVCILQSRPSSGTANCAHPCVHPSQWVVCILELLLASLHVLLDGRGLRGVVNTLSSRTKEHRHHTFTLVPASRRACTVVLALYRTHSGPFTMTVITKDRQCPNRCKCAINAMMMQATCQAAAVPLPPIASCRAAHDTLAIASTAGCKMAQLYATQKPNMQLCRSSGSCAAAAQVPHPFC